jgi:hypothetical protein
VLLSYGGPARAGGGGGGDGAEGIGRIWRKRWRSRGSRVVVTVTLRVRGMGSKRMGTM